MKTLLRFLSVFGGTALGLIVGAAGTFLVIIAYSAIFVASAYREGAIVWISFYAVPVGALVGTGVGFVRSITSVLNVEDRHNGDGKKQSL